MKPPKESLYRAVMPGVTLEERDTGSGMPTLSGHFAVFNDWTEINSAYEGRFMERIAPGAFKKTFAENRDNIKALFQHGRDPQIGDKPLGKFTELREDETGAAYSVDLLDTQYNRELIPGLKAGLYGASFRFSVVRDDFNEDAERSAYNPDGLPERTLQEVRVMEGGPVTFGAYKNATAGVRSITDLIHDVDAVTRATPILLDDERLERARIFVSRSIPTAEFAVPYEDDPTGAEYHERKEAERAAECACDGDCACGDLPERADAEGDTPDEAAESREAPAEAPERPDVPRADRRPIYGMSEKPGKRRPIYGEAVPQRDWEF